MASESPFETLMKGRGRHEGAIIPMTMTKIFLVNVDEIADEAASSLSAERRRKAERCLFEKDRLLSLAAGFALDKGLQGFGLREKEAETAYGEHGKPYLKGHPEIHFSLSHSEKLALACFDEKEVGCDLEALRPCKESIVASCFSEEEKRYVESSPNKDEAFTRVWTCKESFLKAIGVGISAPLPSFSAFPKGNRVALIQSLDSREWEIEERREGPYFIAICHQK